MPRSSTKRRGNGMSSRKSTLRSRTKTNDHLSTPNQRGSRGSSTGFTLADVARTTAHGQDAWTRESHLRSRPISFVSAGAADPMRQLDEQLQRKARNDPEELLQRHNDRGQDYTKSSSAAPGAESVAVEAESTNTGDPFESISRGGQEHLETSVSRRAVSKITAVPPLAATDPNFVGGSLGSNCMAITEADRSASPETNHKPMSPPLFFVDTTRGSSYHDRISQQEAPYDRLDDPDSDSSEDVILFKGRNHSRRATSPVSELFGLEKLRTEIHVVSETTGASTAKNTAENKPPKKSRNQGSASKNNSKKSRGNQQKKNNSRLHPVNMEEDEVLADYIANMRQYENEDEADLSHLSRLERNLDSSETDSPTEAYCPVGSTDVVPGCDVEATADTSTTTCFDNLAAEKRMINAARRNHAGPAEEPPQNAMSLSDDLDSEADIVAAWSRNRVGMYSRDPDYKSWDEIAKPRRKQRKGNLPQFDVSDSELEAEMQATFKRDRLKKAERKRERQELRALGLLGRKADPQGLQAKYPQGMALDQIADELKTFLLGTQSRKVFSYLGSEAETGVDIILTANSLTLPPMDNHARKVIHELANKFNIKSKSTGTGNQRRPALYRTVRTFQYTEEVFDTAISRVSRKYFSRRDVAVNLPSHRSSGRRGGAHSATSYRDGEVVGGSAPELGQENRGRAMLEKMGWSDGTALGTITNKGILQPVAHVVKRGKAGLG
ncbi:hypothetical protein ACRALDRAFT_2045180 [Sodiomyces alcalophilus JCM 7366]|uniref:uncharacterized protein n=1 Tax=Sodiomyces alcalophilus JCM 7366 TaxID=591952 RepID=UPI0039B62CED